MFEDEGDYFTRSRECPRCRMGFTTHEETKCWVCRIYAERFDAYSWLHNQVKPDGECCLVFFRWNGSRDFIDRWGGKTEIFFGGEWSKPGQIVGWNVFKRDGKSKLPMPLRIISRVKTTGFIATHDKLDPFTHA